MPKTDLHVVIHGRVQGVGFRWFTRERARALGLCGTVRNRPDGAVEVHAAGPSDEIARFRAILEQGPPAARVSDLEELPRPGEPIPDGEFRILR